MIIEKIGNLFTSQHQTLVNTINCVGVMGTGVALEFKCRYPDMFARYRDLCAAKELQPGRLWLYTKSPQWVLNFPTKAHWNAPSREIYLKEGLEKFVSTYEQRGITSIAFPLLGASNGKINPVRSKQIMGDYLVKCTIPIEIWEHDTTSADEKIEAIRFFFQVHDNDTVASLLDIHPVMVHRLRMILPDIILVTDVYTKKGIHTDIVTKLFSIC